MKIKKIELKNYRNYEKLKLDFFDDLNIIYGNNGSGKTNIVEAIYILALTKSFRTNNDQNLIKIGTDFASVSAEIEKKDKEKFKIEIFKEGKCVYYNDDKVKKISDYITKINVVLFNPLDVKIYNDSPSMRRKLLNVEISQINKEYLMLLSNYNKLLKNRNIYLKQMHINGNSSMEYINILTNKLIEYGLKINNIRENYIEMINSNISQIYKNIFGYGELTVKYESFYNNKTKEELIAFYKKNLIKELSFGKTLYGINRDDIKFILDKKLLKDFGSIGQQKNAFIAFKLSEIIIIKKKTGEYPILILDDLFSELDDIKINNIITMLNKEVQTFITTTDIDKINKKLIKNSIIYYIDNASVQRRDIYEQ
ncbi:MAG: DNA replication/repair protein RecF [Mollicutes bacterium]|nr:DNA replication/repair protein RecF [Mollicutes bacterium]